jgi:hypothetical protein
VSISPDLSCARRRVSPLVERRVGAILDLPDLFAQRGNRPVILADGVEIRHDLPQHGGGVDDRVGQRPHFGLEFDDAVTLDLLRRVLDQVDAVVEHVGERQDVLAVDRRVERTIGGDEDLPRDRVRGDLDVANAPSRGLPGDAIADHRPKHAGRARDALGLLAKKRGETPLRRASGA